VCPFVCLFFHSSVCLSVRLSVCQSLYLPIYLSVSLSLSLCPPACSCLFVCPSFCSSVHICICLSICPCFVGWNQHFTVQNCSFFLHLWNSRSDQIFVIIFSNQSCKTFFLVTNAPNK
jgi:hypothetical protein